MKSKAKSKSKAKKAEPILVVELHGKNLGVRVCDEPMLAKLRASIVAAVADVAFRTSMGEVVGGEARLAEMCALMWKVDDGRVLVMVDVDRFDRPGAWGIIIADLVGHVANAYVARGFDPVAVAAEVRRVVLAELASPTDKPRSIGKIAGES